VRLILSLVMMFLVYIHLKHIWCNSEVHYSAASLLIHYPLSPLLIKKERVMIVLTVLVILMLIYYVEYVQTGSL